MAEIMSGRKPSRTLDNRSPHALPFIIDRGTITWERLENLRLKKLGLGNRYSRHFGVKRQINNMDSARSFELGPCSTSNKSLRFTPRLSQVSVVVKQHEQVEMGEVSYVVLR